MMQICRCKIDDSSKSISRVSVLEGCVQSAQAYNLCADLDVRAQWVSNQLLTPGSSFGVTVEIRLKIKILVSNRRRKRAVVKRVSLSDSGEDPVL